MDGKGGAVNFVLAITALVFFWLSASEFLKFMVDTSSNYLNWGFVFAGIGFRLTLLSTSS